MMTFSKLDSWRSAMRENFNCIEELADFLQLEEKDRQKLLKTSKFPLNLPIRLARKIQKGTLEDPILKQFVPLDDELQNDLSFLNDPVGDVQSRKCRKLLHKYQGRVLLTVSAGCAVHCRFCFRQHFDYETEKTWFEEELNYLRKDASINEVILSGGDPLSLSNERLGGLISRCIEIPHLKKLRFHSRFPVAIPDRIDEGFLEIIRRCSLKVWFVLHCNHPSELGEDLFEKMYLLRSAGAILLNQNVLLRGVNDRTEILQELYTKLTDQGIMPYYIHQLDRVQGASHFEVSIEKGKQLMRELSRLLPGYAVPKYVQEVPGWPGKSMIHY